MVEYCGGLDQGTCLNLSGFAFGVISREVTISTTNFSAISRKSNLAMRFEVFGFSWIILDFFEKHGLLCQFIAAFSCVFKKASQMSLRSR